ncbi:MAG: hypothetical protein AAGH46_13315, partial [Bacteroidota bacterium]
CFIDLWSNEKLSIENTLQVRDIEELYFKKLTTAHAMSLRIQKMRCSFSYSNPSNLFIDSNSPNWFIDSMLALSG